MVVLKLEIFSYSNSVSVYSAVPARTLLFLGAIRISSELRAFSYAAVSA